LLTFILDPIFLQAAAAADIAGKADIIRAPPTDMGAFNIKGTTWHKAFKKSVSETKVTAIDDSQLMMATMMMC
jgi:hypothetical protein